MFCEVRLDCCAGESIFPVRNVRCARCQHQWLSCLAARLTNGSQRPIRRPDAGVDRLDSRRIQRRVRQPAHDARGFSASKARGERLMRDNGIHARHKRRYKVTTDSKHGLPVAENLLARNFTPTAPNQVWTSDITYLWTDEGWLYLAIVLDLFNREIVG